ncbi:putative membrane protein [Gordonia polyisoprenivorans VH2]|uniref:Putative membrane protein n=2 Tax=Gordonia polyisoprenivorans TaxID=84595 RepID=H6MT80_GORPV|nr:putative membrane protein [Gordonia polyisoprenivorans VH2]
MMAAMWRQLVGFAVFAGALSVFVASISGQGFPGMGCSVMWGSGLCVSFGDSGIWRSLTITAAVGAFLGVTLGAVLWWAGVRVSGATDNRLGRVVCAGLLGVIVGLSPALVIVGTAFAGRVDYDVTTQLAAYGISAVLAYVLGVAAVYLVLRMSKDSRRETTALATAVALPLGAAAATGAGVAVARHLGYTTDMTTWVATVLAATAVVAATFALARGWALRSGPTGSAASDQDSPQPAL